MRAPKMTNIIFSPTLTEFNLRGKKSISYSLSGTEKPKPVMILMLSPSQTGKYLKASTQKRDVYFCKGYSILLSLRRQYHYFKEQRSN